MDANVHTQHIEIDYSRLCVFADTIELSHMHSLVIAWCLYSLLLLNFVGNVASWFQHKQNEKWLHECHDLPDKLHLSNAGIQRITKIYW